MVETIWTQSFIGNPAFDISPPTIGHVIQWGQNSNMLNVRLEYHSTHSFMRGLSFSKCFQLFSRCKHLGALPRPICVESQRARCLHAVELMRLVECHFHVLRVATYACQMEASWAFKTQAFASSRKRFPSIGTSPVSIRLYIEEDSGRWRDGGCISCPPISPSACATCFSFAKRKAFVADANVS